MDKKLALQMALAEIALAQKPPQIDEVRFVKPTVYEPVIISQSGQEKRRRRRQMERAMAANRKKQPK